MITACKPLFFIMKKITFLLAALLFSVIGNTQTFTEIIKSTAFDRDIDDRLGYAVDISGNYAIVGAYGDDFGALNPNMGSAYIFEKTGIEDWTFVQKIQSSDQDDYDRFGWSVAINGSYAVVGAYAEDEDENDMNYLSKAGSAYVFERDSAGMWVQVQKIVASDRDTSDEFGWTVDISGETIIVGAHHEGHDELGGDFIFKSGSVYAFDRGVDGEWTESQKIVAWDRQPDSGGGDETINIWHYQDIDYGDLFGCSIAISGDFMIVGAHNGDYNPAGFSGIDQAGAAYIFRRVAGVWVDDQKVCATSRGGWDRYGYSVDIDSNVAVVGAKAEDESEFEAAFLHNAGSAYIYTRGIDGTWGTAQKIDASDRGVGDHFGIDVAVENDIMVIGAESNNFDEFEADDLNNAGAAYIFEKADDGTWSEIQKIDASDRVLEDWFANAIAISEHTIIVGAWQQDFNEIGLDSLKDAGAAYFFSSLLCSTETTSQSITLCAGESVTVGFSVYTETGSYIDTLLNSGACDSIVTTNLMVLPVIASSNSIEICFGETYEVGLSSYNETGIYLDTLTSEFGCDSLVTTDLFVNAELNTEQTFTLCFGQSITVGGSTYTETGEYLDTFISESGCDSLVTTFLTVSEEIDNSITIIDVITLSSNEPSGGTTSFQWIDCETEEPIPGATEQNFVAVENGEYAVIVTKDICVDTSSCYSINSVGYSPIENELFSIYPNPTNGIVHVSIEERFIGTSVKIYSVLGELILVESITSTQLKIDLSQFEKGIYLIEFTVGDTVVNERISLH